MVDFTQPPVATLLIAAMAIGLNLASSVGRRFLTDVEKSRRIRAETKAFRKELMGAVKSGDKAKEQKLKKKEKKMKELEMKMSTETMKVTFLFMGPFIIVYWIMSGWMGQNIVAVSPTPIPLPFFPIPSEMTFFWWYLISSLGLSGVITKALRVGLD